MDLNLSGLGSEGQDLGIPAGNQCPGSAVVQLTYNFYYGSQIPVFIENMKL
jgi:hypothetical protein